jgi:hypothetical protein
MEAPVLIKPIPQQAVNERAAYGPLDLTEYISAPNAGEDTEEGEASEVHFEADIEGMGLPQGMICTYDGIFTGIPAKGTAGTYEVNIEASNKAGSIKVTFNLVITPAIPEKDTQDYIDALKQEVWAAIENDQPIPELSELLGRDVTPLEVYYLLERWATLTIFDAYNLDAPGEKKEIHLQGVSPHFVTYDRGSCLVAAPKDLYSHERTLADAIQTAQVLAREAVRRDWVVELVGFSKLTRAAWVEIQHLGEAMNKKIDVLNFEPTTRDIKLYQESSQAGFKTRNIE